MAWWRKKWPTVLASGALVVVGALLLFVMAVMVTPLPAPNNPQTTEILDAHGAPLGRLFTENRIEIPVVDMPTYLLHAIVAVEDDRFYRHPGIDVFGIGRALVRNVTAGRVVEGGSTITQQLAKNLYLSHERTVTRKIREAVLTLKLEMTYSKNEILGMYWNTVYLGAGTYGAEVASQTYFGKSARQLTLSEAATLAGIPRSPEYYSPRNEHAQPAIERRNLVLAKMADEGYITPVQAQAAQQEPIVLAPAQERNLREAAYFVDYLKKEIQERYPDLAASLYQGGYQIETTLDWEMQRIANEAVRGNLPDDADVQAALVAVDPHTGEVRAMVGGRGAAVDRNRALEPNQPGSAFKPFVYAAALETHTYTPMSTQVDEPVQFPGAEPGTTWEPKNWNNQYTNQPTSMREALKHSLNTVTAQWANSLTPAPIEDVARRAGIQSDQPDNLTMALGSGEVTPLELTAAYSVFANGGNRVRPTAIRRILDHNGLVMVEAAPVRDRVLEPGIAFIITDMLKDVFEPGGTSANLARYIGDRPVAGKTGTTDEGRAAWFVGYSPNLVAGVWVGTDDDRPSERSGSYSAGPIWAEFLSDVEGSRVVRDWQPPADVVATQICTLTGLMPNATCPVGREYFLRGTEPTEVDRTIHDVAPEWPAAPGEAPPENATRPLIPGLPNFRFRIPGWFGNRPEPPVPTEPPTVPPGAGAPPTP